MRRIFIKALLQEKLVITGGDAHHLGRVMRAKAGDRILVADDEGKVGEYELTGFTESSVSMRLIQYVEERTESPVEIVLAQCLPKGDKLDLIVQKATELGVNAIVPLASDNCVVRYDSKKAQARQEKWQKIADEAGKQCGRSRLPEVQPVQPFGEWLREMAGEQSGDTAICMCYENELQQGMKEFLQGRKAAKRFVVIVGPEGGFSLAEAALAKELGIASVSLGTRILRAETAAISAVALIQYENGDLGGR
ncbi:16S rRNA (uracil(1498)-N(3))-methyltransferase [Anaerovibrio sp.]|uniref:16S rRNA (uracil(1498)-N(3))-methyltransferase n=1 Tax=Anaerovibrio sp. TaxID=1872532 RepID=UPI00262FA095|nr:16S rRNA (uracil(1498)-N(3))-methyltransferase [Anaerovibrio sp.]MDD6598035.1 16S rRNA (uracil(1498)-N(3))-methyltransferase [Anaerovibrio sp.]